MEVACYADTADPECNLEIMAPEEATPLSRNIQSDSYDYTTHGYKSQKADKYRVPVSLYGDEFICRANCREVNVTVEETAKIVFERKTIVNFELHVYQ